MINLFYLNDNVFVFDTKDWLILRKKYRIIGEFFGDTLFIPTLPLRLSNEEVFSLINENIGKLVTIDPSFFSTDIKKRECNKNFEDSLLEEQKIRNKLNRKDQLEGMIDKIFEAKRKKGDQRGKDEIFHEELEKSSKITSDIMLWPIFNSPMQLEKHDLIDVDKNLVLDKVNLLKCKVYQDLWKRGYYITNGQKFGGDFLVYLDDPIGYHAIFIVHCILPNQCIFPSEIVSWGRLGTSVKKNIVIASTSDDNSITYTTIKWIDA